MNIQYYGHSCFKMTTKPFGRGQNDITVFFDPFDKKVGLRPPQGSADIVFVSHDHHDHNNVEALKGDPVVLDIPGEYSVKGVNVIGLETYHDEKKGEENGKNTIFVLDSEDIKVCHLGDLGEELTAKQLDKIGQIDILMIPIGGKYTLDYKKAVDLIKKVEPAIVIPMHYKMNGSTIQDIEDEKKFCGEIGNCPKEKINKFTFKKKDLEGKSMEVILMGVE